MACFSHQVDIAAPASAVWAILEDVRRLPEFSPGTIEVTDAPACITEVGQTYGQVGKILGKRWTSEWTVTELDPGRRLTAQGTIGPGVAYCVSQRVAATADDRSSLEIVVTYDLPGGALGRLANRAGIEARARKESVQVLERIKAEAERGA